MSSVPVSQSELIARPDELQVRPALTLYAGETGGHRRRFVTRRRTIVGAVVLLMVGGGLGTWLATRPASTPAASTQIVTVGYGTVEQTASATGTIAPSNVADLNFAVSGRVSAVEVSVGQAVTAGQPLATIDPTALTAQVDEAQATLDSAEARLSSDESSTSTSSAQLTADEATVTAAQASLSSAQGSLSYATLTSTISGTVASLNLTVGQQVSSSGSGGPGGASGASGASSSSSSSSSGAQVVVESTGSYVVDATVENATEVGEIQTGDQATITPQGASSNVYGQVASMSLMATQSSGLASFPVVIDVTGSPTGLYPGTTAAVTILYKELQNVLVVPTAAIGYSGGKTTVVVDQNGKPAPRTVTLGITYDGYTQIQSGLGAGDKVVERVVSSRSTGASRDFVGAG